MHTKTKRLRDSLATHLSILEREELITPWHDRDVGAGEEWKGAIDAHCATAHLVLLLVSPDFIASDYCYGIEMKNALERHERGETKVIPIILRPVDWTAAPFGKLQALPKDGRPVAIWPNRDQAFNSITQDIRKALQTYRERGCNG